MTVLIMEKNTIPAKNLLSQIFYNLSVIQINTTKRLIDRCCYKATPLLVHLLLQNASKFFILFVFTLTDWVNPSKRGGMDGVFRGLAGLALGKPRPSRLFYLDLHSN